MGWALLVGLHLWLGREITLPARGPGDQWGYVGSARFLAGDPHTYVMPHFPYFTYGYSVLLAPLTRVWDDPADLFLAIKVLNAALAASVLPLLYLCGRCIFGVRAAPALAGAAVGALVPPLIVHPTAILAENLVLPLVLVMLLSCWLFLSERPDWQRLLFAPSMVWLHVTHNRFAAVLPLFFGLLAAVAAARAVPRRLVAANAVLGLAGLVVAQLVRNAIVAARWVDGIETPQGPASDAVEVLTDRHLFFEYLLVAVGQVWYLAVSTFGVALVGIAVVVWRTMGGPSRPTAVGRTHAIRRLLGDPQRLTMAFLLASAAMVFATSAYFFTRVVNGSEGFVVGRHNESFVALWVAVGVSFLVAPTSERAVRWAVAGALVATGSVTAVVLWGRQDGELGSAYSALNVPALAPYGSVGDAVVHEAAAVALVGLSIAVGLALARRRLVAPLVVMVLWFPLGLEGELRQDPLLEGWTAAGEIEATGIDRIATVSGRFSGMPVYYPYHLPETTFVPWDAAWPPPAGAALAPLDAGFEQMGARIAVVDYPVVAVIGHRDALALWVFDDDDVARLDAAGALLPAGYPSALPDAARRADLTWTESTSSTPAGTVVLELASGARAPVTVRARHPGDSPVAWPGQGGTAPSTRVYVRSEPVDPTLPVVPATRVGELAVLVQSGTAQDTTVVIEAVDPSGAPLPPGRYHLRVVVARDREPGFAQLGAPLEIDLRVT